MQKDDLIGGEIINTVSNRFWGDHKCDAIFLLPTTHITMKEMIDGMRLCFNFDSVDVLSSAKLMSRLVAGDEEILGAVSLAVEKHQVGDIVLFRHQSYENGKIFRAQSMRKKEDRAKIRGLLKARGHLLKVYPNVRVRMIYARFVEDGKIIELYEILPDRKEIFWMRFVNRFMSEDGIEIPCQALIFTCMDYRQFREVRARVRDDYKLDLLRISGLPGSSKKFLECIEGGDVSWNEFKKMVLEHPSDVFFIFHHGDCGAYGGLAFFDGDAEAEELKHREDMYRLRDLILQLRPDAKVELVYARFIEDGRRIRFVRFD